MSNTDLMIQLVEALERGVNIPARPLTSERLDRFHDYSFGSSDPRLRPVVPAGI